MFESIPLLDIPLFFKNMQPKNKLKPHVQTETRSSTCMMQTGSI